MASNELKAHILASVDREDFALMYDEYIDNLDRVGVPVVFEIEHLSALTGIKLDILGKMVGHSQSFYRQFSIQKSSGGYRTINAPYPSLLQVQRWISKNILSKIPLSDFAHGFIADRSIISNSLPHLGADKILKLDIAGFFPSIKTPRIFSIFRSFGYSDSVSFILARLCTCEGSLPQGAATSPALSNLVSRRMDKRLSSLAKCAEINYTRYADDLTFSGTRVSLALTSIVGRIALEEGFKLNSDKIKLMSGHSRKIVVGISVGGSSPKIPKASKREIRRDVHLLLKLGIERQSTAHDEFDPLYVDRLLGRLSFWRSVEPDNKFVRQHWSSLQSLARLKTLS